MVEIAGIVAEVAVIARIVERDGIAFVAGPRNSVEAAVIGVAAVGAVVGDIAGFGGAVATSGGAEPVVDVELVAGVAIGASGRYGRSWRSVVDAG